MNRSELLQLYDMSYEETVISIFKLFPKKQSYTEEVIKALPSLSKVGYQISVSHEYSYYIDIFISGMCSFRKHWEREDYSDKRIYRFSFGTGDALASNTISRVFEKDTSDIFCDRVLPFIFSRGENRKSIPLIMHDFPEFAKFALDYNPNIKSPSVLRFIDSF